MYKKLAITLPTLCFIAGFLGSLLLLTGNDQIAEDGVSYFSDENNISFWSIYLNNTLMCALFILGSGVGSSIMLLIQGFSFGMQYVAWILMGNAAAEFWLLFLPHVVFEVIAMALAGYLGFQLLRFLTKKTGQTLRELIRDNRTILIATFATVLFAALVECHLTPVLYTLA